MFSREFCSEFPPSPIRGRRESRVRAAPAVSCANDAQKNAHEHTGPAEAIRLSLRNGLQLITRSPRRPGFLATVIPEKPASQELDASVGASGPHAFAVRKKALSSSALLSVHRIPPRVRDDREPPLCGTGRQGIYADLRFRKIRIFLQKTIDRGVERSRRRFARRADGTNARHILRSSLRAQRSNP